MYLKRRKISFTSAVAINIMCFHPNNKNFIVNAIADLCQYHCAIDSHFLGISHNYPIHPFTMKWQQGDARHEGWHWRDVVRKIWEDRSPSLHILFSFYSSFLDFSPFRNSVHYSLNMITENKIKRMVCGRRHRLHPSQYMQGVYAVQQALRSLGSDYDDGGGYKDNNDVTKRRDIRDEKGRRPGDESGHEGRSQPLDTPKLVVKNLPDGHW